MMRRSFVQLFVLLLATAVSCRIASAQEPKPYRLTLRDAIQRGLQANLSVLVADTRVEEAEGTSTRRLSAAVYRALPDRVTPICRTAVSRRLEFPLPDSPGGGRAFFEL